MAFVCKKSTIPIFEQFTKTDSKILMHVIKQLDAGSFIVSGSYRGLADEINVSFSSVCDSMKRLTSADLLMVCSYSRFALNPNMIYVGSPNTAKENYRIYRKMKVERLAAKMARANRRLKAEDLPMKEFEPLPEKEWEDDEEF